MKKLLVIALLMLALVITAVACNNDPVEPGTSAEDVTTAETPTEAPDEPDTPAPDTQEPETPAPDTNEPETPAPDTKEPETDEPAPETEPTVILDKTEYLPGESIMVSATGSNKDWVGIVIAGTDYSLRWWYVADVGEGVAIDVLNETKIQAGTSTATGDLPAGEYEVVWVSNDQTIVDAAKVYRYKFTVKDPSAPAWIVGADQLNELANVAGASNTSAELKDGYISLTAKGGDPWFMAAGNLGEMPEYLAIRYRTNASQGGEIFIGNGTGPVGGESFLFTYNANSEWNLLIFHLPTVAPYMATPAVGYIRFDYYTGGPDEGFLDIAYMGFFNTPEDVLKYDFENYKAPMWNETDFMKHLSFDELDTYSGGNKVAGVFTPGQSAGWNGLLELPDYSVDTLRFWGWIAATGELGRFGYQINGGSAIYNDAWTNADMMEHAPGGVDYAKRMAIMISIAGLDGENDIRVLYKDAAGREVCLSEFSVILPKKPTHYENYNVPQDQWTVTGHCPGIVGAEGHANSGMVAAGGVESGALLHQGSISLGVIDLSKYDKAVLMWGCDNSPVTVGHYENNANNRIMLTSAEVNGTAPAEGTIIAGGTYELGGWAVQAFEIDLSEVDYKGPVYVCIDTLPGTFALFSSVEFIGGEIDYSVPDTPIYNDYTANETVNWTPYGITVDGAIADWNGLNVSSIPTDKLVSWVGSVAEGQSMVTGFAADNKYLYAVVYVTDDTVVSGNKVTDGYNGDVVQIAVTMNGKQSWYSFSYKAEGENYIINTANTVVEGAELATVAIEGGWLAELKLPIRTLFTDAAVTEFTFDAENPWTMQVLVCNLDRDADAEALVSAVGTFTSGEAWKDGGFNLTLNWVDGMKLNHGVIDEMVPANVFQAADIDDMVGQKWIASAELIDDYLHIVPSKSDPNWKPFAKVDGARYVAIRYRSADATDANMQFFMASTGDNPKDDSSMLQKPITVDGEWHVLVIDTQPLIDAGIFDGEYVSYFRFDPLEAGYVLDENGQPYKDASNNWVRYSLPEGCSIDVAYIGFFHCVEAVELYDAAQYPAA